jgi:L-erythro-3,5-diaminohexanoate dehydrogenase
MKKGDKYGAHRVIRPKGVLPQAADVIDNTMDIYDNEILVDVATLNIDSASFTQIEEEAGGDEQKIADSILTTVKNRGKQHNPVTGSGGMFIGRVAEIGPALAGQMDIGPGDAIASLVSLSLTPLRIDEIKKVKTGTDQVDIVGKAILFERTVYCKLPDDMPWSVALAVLDVAGAAAQTAKLVKPGDTVFIIGAGGKSGMLTAYEAKKRAGITGRVIGTGHSKASTKRIEDLGFCDRVIQVDASDPLAVEARVSDLTGGRMADVTINCVNVPNTEMTSIVATKPDGIIYFFSMATSFTKAALGAEGIGSDALMIIGNGYTRGHAEISLGILKECPELMAVFTELYG